MSYKLTFGKHEGKSLEYLFFSDPGYVWYIVQNKIHLDTSKFTIPARNRFEELVRRASHLRIPGMCTWCKKKPITRMFLSRHISGGLGRVDFDCDDCHPMGSSPTAAMKPSFFTPDFYRNYDKTGAEFLVAEIKYAYFRDRSYRMTQKRLEQFFNNHENFTKF